MIRETSRSQHIILAVSEGFQGVSDSFQEFQGVQSFRVSMNYRGLLESFRLFHRVSEGFQSILDSIDEF